MFLFFILALASELTGMSVTTPEQIESTGLLLLEVIPVIETDFDRRRRKRQMLWATVSGTVVTVLAGSAVLLYRFRG